MAMVCTVILVAMSTVTAQNWTGDGGRGTSITILVPQATSLAENQRHLPALVQGEFVTNFTNYSAIRVVDRERMDEVYIDLISGAYDDDAVKKVFDLGRLEPTTYYMVGNITKTGTEYNLQMRIIKTADKTTTASFSRTFTFWQLSNLTGIRQASLDLLPRIGVALTENARQELAGAAPANHVTAQTALARGVTAQWHGAEVAALSYYFQAAAFDPSLVEAVNRSSILNANISSGSMGDNIRNDIAWRKQWVERLEETEKFFDNFNRMESMPYTLFYVPDIKQGAINYQNESVTMSIETYLYGSGVWTLSIERALQAVWDGLNATNRKDVWQLGGWPQRGVTDLNAFARRNNNFSVVFELLNNQKKVIGRQTLQAGGSWGLNWSGRPTIDISALDRKTLHFQNVDANEISDRMAIRVANVNGRDAEAAAIDGILQIRAITGNEVAVNDRFRFAKGEIQGFGNHRVSELVIPNIIWGDPVVSIGNGAFRNAGLTRITIHNGVRFIGHEAFLDNDNLSSVTIGPDVIMGSNSFGGGGFHGFPENYLQVGRRANTYHQSNFRFVRGEIQGFATNAATRGRTLNIPESIWGNPVTSIGNRAFENHQATRIVIPNSVRSIGSNAFWTDAVLSEINIIIGANVAMNGNPFRLRVRMGHGNNSVIMLLDCSGRAREESFAIRYDRNRKAAGTYTFPSRRLGGISIWQYKP